jgi:uncharacterized protein
MFIMPISRRKFLKIAAGSVGVLGGSTLAGSAYITRIEPEAVEITRLDIVLPNLPRVFDGVTLVQISDLHVGDWMTRQRLAKILQQVNALQPDIIAITGDFVSGYEPSTAVEAGLEINTLHARETVVAVLGNHDYWMQRGIPVRQALSRTGNVRLLLNERIAIKRGGEMLHITGIDDVWEHMHNLPKTLDGLPDRAAVIALVHEPDYADQVMGRGQVGLQLSGHSHGGQVRVPGIGALQLPYLSKKYDMGLFNLDGMALYVNRGLGMVRPHVRFNCRPEITHFTLRA